MSKRKLYPDKTDYDALYIWHNDSRISNVSIVERLGHPCTIHSFTRFHVNFLNDMGFVKRWTVLPDWAKFGYEFPVRVRIKIEFADKVDEAIAVAQRIPRVLNFWRVMEEYQLEMTLICENMKEFADEFTPQIQALPYFQDMRYSPVQHMIEELGWIPPIEGRLYKSGQ